MDRKAERELTATAHPEDLNMQATERQTPVHAPMTQFPIENGELVVGGIRLSRLAARVGQTPFYAYDRQLLAQRVARLRAVLPASIKLHYAMKANPMPALVCLMADLVDGIDAGELVASPSLRERLRGAVMVLRIYAVRPPR